VCRYIAHIRDGKNIQTCNDHCKNTATYAFHLLKPVRLSKVGYLAGLLHDMGKYSDEFQEYIKKVSKGDLYKGPKVIHTFTGLSFILNKFHSQDFYKKLTSEIIAIAIGAHHGLFDIYREDKDYNAFLYKIQKQPLYDKKAIENFFKECTAEDEIEKLFKEANEEVKDFYESMASDLASDKTPNTTAYFYLSHIARLVLSAVVEGDRRDTASFMLNKPYDLKYTIEWDTDIISLENSLSKFPCITEIQKARKAFSDACKDFAQEKAGIYRLDLPTGGGKTLSSIRFALNHASIHKKRRIFYVAPLLTILDQNAKVIKETIPTEEDILLHYSNITEETKTEENLDDKELFLESWENKIIITSLVQMLQTMFSGKMSSVRRFHTLTNSIIIFDEIQSLPIKIYSMFNLVLNFLTSRCNSTVILCSATLPSFETVKYPMHISNKTIISKELLAKTKNTFKRTQIKKLKEEIKLDEFPSIVLNELKNSNSILVVCNTKKEAATIFNVIKEKTDAMLFHLSAGMCPKHRKEMLNKLDEALSRDDKLICVSTQVIEAGIDISFSTVFRFAAGIDNVVQSAGRCNRNGNDKKAHNVYIVKIIDEQLLGLNEIQRDKESLYNLLNQFDKSPSEYDNDLASLSAITYYYKILYSSLKEDAQDYPNPNGANAPTLLSYLAGGDQVFQITSQRDRFSDYIYFQFFDTAGLLFSVFDNAQKTIIVPYNDEARDIIAMLQTQKAINDFSYRETLLTKAKNYSVTIFNFSFDVLCKNKAIVNIDQLGIYCLSEEYYDDYLGISTKEVKECDTLMM